NKEYNPDFLYYLLELQKNYLSDQAGVSATRILSKSKFQNLSFFVPPLTEQEKIAECLSSLDELITVQEQKIKTLKHHKNGLMQQLFPKL
nr:restriction endonuclease subunit S [Pseudomonadota bacterium]